MGKVWRLRSVDNETVYFFTSKDIQEYCDVDFQDKTININLHNIDLICRYKGEGKSRLQESLDTINEHIEFAETLDSTIISEQLQIKVNKDIIEHDSEIYDANYEELPEHIETILRDFNTIKEESTEIFGALEPLVSTLRELALESSPILLNTYYENLRHVFEIIRNIEKDKAKHLQSLIVSFYRNYYMKQLDNI